MEPGEVTKVAEPLTVGDRVLERYSVVERIEKGGTSIVYRGEDLRLSRPVCIKVFHTLRKKEGIWRTTYEHFVQEAFTLSKLTHPNTLRIYDFGYLKGHGEEGGPPFQVSEFMQGGTLSQLLRESGPLEADEVVRVITAIGGALDEAHETGIIHRDIKPRNILFSGAGTKRVPKLADFGIAKALEAELKHRAGDTRVVAGKRLLMFSGLWAAPEQLTGQPIGPTADVYSLALVVIYMLTGRCVFSTNDPQDAHRQRTKSDQLITATLDGHSIPPAAAALLKRACAFRAEDRPGGGAFRFAKELAECLSQSSHPGRNQEETETALETSPALEPVSLPRPDSEPTERRKAPPQRLSVSAEAQSVEGRSVRFLAAVEGVVDLVAVGGARLRVSLLPAAGGVAVHLKGLSCFVEREGGRPTSAVQLTADGAVRLIAKNKARLARAEVRFGSPAAGHTVFRIGGQSVAIGTAECPLAIALDFGPGTECLFIYLSRQQAK